MDDQSDLVDAFSTACRALVAISVRSVGEAQPEVTLAQHRILVFLDALGRGVSRPPDATRCSGFCGGPRVTLVPRHAVTMHGPDDGRSTRHFAVV